MIYILDSFLVGILHSETVGMVVILALLLVYLYVLSHRKEG